MDNSESHFVPNFLILVGLATCGINAFGGRVCHDSLDWARSTRWKPVVKNYLCGCIAFCTILVIVALMCFLVQVSLHFALAEGLKNGMKYDKDRGMPGWCFMKRALDMTQIEFHGYGNIRSHIDLMSAGLEIRMVSNVDGNYLMDRFPFSCCNQHHLNSNSAHYDYDHHTEELNLWTKGCREALVCYYGGDDEHNWDSGAATPAFGGEVSGNRDLHVGQRKFLILLTQRDRKYWTTALDTLTNPENPESEIEGRLLQKCDETMSDIMQKIKPFSRGNQ
ncbi:hypothetical protein P4O66_013496, partial [Electrophorus voltai]